MHLFGDLGSGSPKRVAVTEAAEIEKNDKERNIFQEFHLL
jgi:hypothetical protein